jgi:ribosomal protein S18 acetylase RimI-like enzyme
MGKYAVLSTELKRLGPLVRQGVGSTVFSLRWGDSNPDRALLESSAEEILELLRRGDAEAYCRIEGSTVSALIVWEELGWDSEILGLGCGRVHLAAGEEAELRRLLSSWKGRARRAGIEYVTCRRVADSRIMEAEGFILLEEVSYLRGGTSGTYRYSTVRTAGRADEERLREIASSAYSYDRFHADPLIPDIAADRIHREWVTGSLEGRADVVFVAGLKGEAGGFCACILRGEKYCRTGWIDMLAVDPDFRRERLGESLVAAARKYFRENGAATAALCTQKRNRPALNLYRKLGFRLYAEAVTYRLSLSE